MKSQYIDFTQSIDHNTLKQVANRLINGSVGIFPTDTVYGIGCHAFLERPIQQLFHVKDRPSSKPISVLISNLKMLDDLVLDVSEAEYKLMKTFWPGPLTIIFKKKSTVSNSLTSHLDTIGVRMPNHPIAQALMNYVNAPLATTSANLSDLPAGTDITSIFKYFKNKVDFVIDNGPSPIGVASTIIKIENSSFHILRKGSISETMIKSVLERS